MLIKKRSTVFCYDREWNVILDENGEVWISENKVRTNIGQEEPVDTIEKAKEVALLMLKSLSED